MTESIINQAKTEGNSEQSIERFFDPDGRPDWEAIDFEVMCSRCGYNLRMLPKPRCPECGLTFDWPDVLDEAAWRSDFLFEHHWRTRPVRSYFKTIWKSLRPFRFWRQVSIHERVKPKPLWFCIFTSFFWFVFLLHAGAGVLSLVIELIGDYFASTMRSYRLDRLSRDLYGIFEAPFSDPNPELFQIYAVIFGGPLAALVLLCSLRQTLVRCKVRSVQILRVVAYAVTPFYILWLVMFLMFYIFIDVCDNIYPNMPVIVDAVIVICFYFASLPGLLGMYLTAGLKRYLQLPRAWLLGLSAAFVGYLFCITVFVVYQTYIATSVF